MSTRTQVYLTEEQRRRLDDLARAEGTTMAALVRRALDTFLAAERPSPGSALAATFGALPRLSVPDRDEWDRG